METVKSINAKIERRKAKLVELAAERETLLNEIRAIKIDSVGKNASDRMKKEIQKQLTPINKKIEKFNRELFALEIELKTLI